MAKHRDDDLFKDTTMTFGEHLDELRRALLKAFLALMMGTIVGLFVGDWVVDAIKKPLVVALSNYYKTRAVKQFNELEEDWKEKGTSLAYNKEEVDTLVKIHGLIYEVRYVHPSLVNEVLDQTAPRAEKDKAKSKSAAKKLTRRLDITTLVPIFMWHSVNDDPRISPTTLSAQEGFMIWFKACMVVGVVLSSPFVFYYIWSFVAAGLYPHEKKYVHIFLPFSLGLFLLGASTAYFFVFAPVLDFLFGFNQSLGLDPEPRISEWLGFVILLPLGFGVSFQLPLVMLFLERIGVFSVRIYAEKWRIAVLVIFVLSAVLTPADPYSLLLMALPLTFLYFGGILMCKFLPRKKPAGNDLAT